MENPASAAHCNGLFGRVRKSSWYPIFVILLNAAAVLSAGIMLTRLIAPPATIPSVNNDAPVDGLVPTGDVAQDARQYLKAVQVSPLSTPLSDLLANPTIAPEATHEHPLLGKAAPDFTLNDDRGESHRLSDMLENGPVVVVFYFGYHCSHCVAQLFGINDDLGRFRELNAQVVALSADSTDITAARFEQYGRFDFPVLFDDQNRIAEQYGVYRRAQGERIEDLRHGTFVIDRDGKVKWANVSRQPFVDNKSLLLILAGKSAE